MADKKFNQNQTHGTPTDGIFEGDDIDFVDLENYTPEKGQMFNHQALVMKVLHELIKNGCVELRNGFVNNKGQYIEDTRSRYIQTVKVALTIMTRDFDKSADEKIGGLLQSLKTKKQELLDDQWAWFSNLKPEPKKYYINKISKFTLCRDLDWHTYYAEFEIDTYREIETELHNLTKRLMDYQVQEIIG